MLSRPCVEEAEDVKLKRCSRPCVEEAEAAALPRSVGGTMIRFRAGTIGVVCYPMYGVSAFVARLVRRWYDNHTHLIFHSIQEKPRFHRANANRC